MSNIEQNILDAIEIITERELSELELDKTIKATVKEVVDFEQNKYKVAYQDANFTAYNATNEEIKVGEQVYVLVPQHDFSKDCFIIANMSTILNKRDTIIETLQKEIETLVGGLSWEDM